MLPLNPEIGNSVDIILIPAEKHVNDRLESGEIESVLISVKSHESMGNAPTPSKISSTKVSPKITAQVEQKQLEAKEASERLQEMEKGQQQKEKQTERLAVEVEITRQRTKEAKRVAELNKSRAEEAKQLLKQDCDTVKDFLSNHDSATELPVETRTKQFPGTTLSSIKLKGVEAELSS